MTCSKKLPAQAPSSRVLNLDSRQDCTYRGARGEVLHTERNKTDTYSQPVHRLPCPCRAPHRYAPRAYLTPFRIWHTGFKSSLAYDTHAVSFMRGAPEQKAEQPLHALRKSVIEPLGADTCTLYPADHGSTRHAGHDSATTHVCVV